MSRDVPGSAADTGEGRRHGFPELALLCSPAYPSEPLRGALCAIGIRPLQHEIRSLRELVQRRTGLEIADWRSPDELAKILLLLVRQSAASKAARALAQP